MSSPGKAMPAGWMGGAGLLLLMTAAAAWWRVSLRDASSDALPYESWERVKEAYPMPAEAAAEASPAAETAAALIEANPFSPARRAVVPAPGQPGGGTGTAAAVVSGPKFLFKGRVQLGARRRAVVEETAGGKTYFLEVGQEVAGFKVLDIDEKRVLLSDPQTHEEVAVLLSSAASPP